MGFLTLFLPSTNFSLRGILPQDFPRGVTWKHSLRPSVSTAKSPGTVWLNKLLCLALYQTGIELVSGEELASSLSDFRKNSTPCSYTDGVSMSSLSFSGTLSLVSVVCSHHLALLCPQVWVLLTLDISLTYPFAESLLPSSSGFKSLRGYSEPIGSRKISLFWGQLVTP